MLPLRLRVASGSSEADDPAGQPFGGTDLQVLAVVAQRLRILAEDSERAVASERLAESGHLLAPHLAPEMLVHTGAELLQRLTISDDAWVVGVTDGMAYRRAHHGTATDNKATTAPRPVEDLAAWPSAVDGRAWTSTAASWSGSAPRTVMCIPLMCDGAPVALLYATRNSPRPYGVGVLEIATIFASYFGAAMDNADMYHELHRRATLDPLTGLANRDLAVQRLDQSLTTGDGLFTGLLFCDLDGFKSVNDRLGHDAGDELLQQVAARFQKGLRPNDLIARFGGDEFVAILGEVETVDDVTDVGRRLVKSLNEPFDLGEERIAVSASIGGALGIRGETTAVEMLHNADIAMYAAKSRGAGGVEVFENTTSKRSLH
jgi:diguanylate cyclase (GGDEF)-like protein